MHSFKKSVLTSAIAALTLGAQFASANVSQFIDDASLSGKVRAVSRESKESDLGTPGTKTYGAFAGGLALDAKSGYAWDVIGFDASFYGATKFDMNAKNEDNGSLLTKKNEGFGKLGQAYVKVKLGNDDLGALLKAGRQRISTGLVSGSGSRAVPSSWQGYVLTGNAADVTFGLAYADKVSQRNQAGFEDINNGKGKKIDYVAGGELGYSKDGLALTYRNGISKDYLEAHNVRVAYTLPLSEGSDLTVGSSYYTIKKDGNLWTASKFDKKAKTLSLDAKLTLDELTLTAAVTRASAAKAGSLGQYYGDFGDNNAYGDWSVGTAGTVNDFDYDGETAWSAGASYDFSGLGVQGLSAGYTFRYGSGMKVAGENLSESEHDLNLSYAFQQDSLKGLSLSAEYGLYKTSDKALRKANGYGKAKALNVYLDYNFVAF